MKAESGENMVCPMGSKSLGIAGAQCRMRETMRGGRCCGGQIGSTKLFRLYLEIK